MDRLSLYFKKVEPGYFMIYDSVSLYLK